MGKVYSNKNDTEVDSNKNYKNKVSYWKKSEKKYCLELMLQGKFMFATKKITFIFSLSILICYKREIFHEK